jgi:hypothetical protein
VHVARWMVSGESKSLTHCSGAAVSMAECGLHPWPAGLCSPAKCTCKHGVHTLARSRLGTARPWRTSERVAAARPHGVQRCCRTAARCGQSDVDDWRPGSGRSSGRRLPEDSSGEEDAGWRERLWDALDVGATLGSIGGAVVFVLTQEALLVGLPVVLPLLALFASRRREALRLEARHA